LQDSPAVVDFQIELPAFVSSCTVGTLALRTLTSVCYFFVEDFTLPSSADLAFWLLTTLLNAFVAFLFVLQGLLSRFLFLSFYFMLSATVSILQAVVLFHFGLFSAEYSYFFFVTHALVSVSLLFSVTELSFRVSGTRMLRWKIAMWVGTILLAMACFGVESVKNSRVPRFLLESSQSVLLTCGFAVVLLCAWKVFRNSRDRVAAKLVSVLGVYFLLFFMDYGAREIFPSLMTGLYTLSWMSGGWLPLGCGFALVSQD